MSVPSRSDSTVKACVVSIFSFSWAKIACASCSVHRQGSPQLGEWR
jgi:hypothetical protein